jgi:transposase-like protein
MRTRRPRPSPVQRSAFTGFRFPPDVIVLAVRWYLRFGLSYRDVEELLAATYPMVLEELLPAPWQRNSARLRTPA